jgi:hypothetical protein
MKFPSDSQISIAAVCLYDAIHTAEHANYAFHEILADRKWYLEKRDPPLEGTANSFAVFYADDAALRLYSAGERMANAIVFMLELNEKDLEPYRQSNRVSLQVIVGHYLIRERSDDPITRAVLKLVKSKEFILLNSDYN